MVMVMVMKEVMTRVREGAGSWIWCIDARGFREQGEVNSSKRSGWRGEFVKKEWLASVWSVTLAAVIHDTCLCVCSATTFMTTIGSGVGARGESRARGVIRGGAAGAVDVVVGGRGTLLRRYVRRSCAMDPVQGTRIVFAGRHHPRPNPKP